MGEWDKQYIIALILFLFLIFLVAFSYEMNKADSAESSLISFVKNVWITQYWACMDGCSNMDEIINGKYQNMTLEENAKAKIRHDACAIICSKQYHGVN